MRVDVGFEYLRPHYTNRATTLVVPAGAEGAFPARAGLGDVTHDFAFAPRFGIEYTFPDTAGFGVGASGKLFTLQGDLRRTTTGPGGTGVLNAENTVSVGSANVLEGRLRFDMSRLEWCRGGRLEDLTLVGSFGGRYTYVRQDFSASLVSGPNVTSLIATQDFTGYGVTASLGGLLPVGEARKFAVYGLSRGSVLAGRNNKTSTFSAVVAGGPGSSGGQQTERRTDLIPVGEFEAGVAWGLPVRAAAIGDPAPPPLLWLRVGVAAQVWGNLGLADPPAASRPPGGPFSNDPLVLYGFTVQAGFAY